MTLGHVKPVGIKKGFTRLAGGASDLKERTEDRDMHKLFHFRKWLTLPQAAQRLSIVFGEQVEEADVLRLALDGHLTLSINLVNHARGRCGTVVSIDEAQTREIPAWALPPSLPGEVRDGPLRGLKGICIDENQVLELKEEVETIDGVWDLPMIGSERLDVEHEYQKRTNGPEVTLTGLSGTFLRADDGRLCQLQEHFADNEFVKKDTLKKPGSNPQNYYPAGGLPTDGVLVVRTSAIEEFEKRVSGAPMEKPIGERERITLLTMIAALAKDAKIDLSKPSKAAAAIETMTEQMGARIPARTAEEHIKRISDALEKRGKTSA